MVVGKDAAQTPSRFSVRSSIPDDRIFIFIDSRQARSYNQNRILQHPSHQLYKNRF